MLADETIPLSPASGLAGKPWPRDHIMFSVPKSHWKFLHWSKARANSFCPTLKYLLLRVRHQDPVSGLRYDVKIALCQLAEWSKYEWQTQSLRKAEVLSHLSSQHHYPPRTVLLEEKIALAKKFECFLSYYKTPKQAFWQTNIMQAKYII